MLKRIMMMKLPDSITWILLVLFTIFLHFFEVHMYCSTHWLRGSSARTLMCISGLGAVIVMFLLWILFTPVKNWVARIVVAIIILLLHGILHPTL